MSGRPDEPDEVLENEKIDKEDDEVKALALSLPDECKKIVLMKTPAMFIKSRPGTGINPDGSKKMFKYVEGGYVELVLNNMFEGKWNFEVLREMVNGKHITVLGKLTVYKNGADIIKTQYGGAEIKYRQGTDEAIDIANDYKAAATDAMKKCASMLGVAFDIYHPGVQAAIERFIGQRRQ